MAHNLLSEEYEETLKGDCHKLFVVLKNCENANERKEEESLKILYRITFLISYRQTSKMAVITTFTVKYLCQHPVLPVILVEILRESHNIKVCAYVLEILAKTIIKSSSVSECDRKSARRAFAEPSNFRTIIEAFQKLYHNFIQEKTNPVFYEMQLRLLKIINCVYIRKGHSQISLLHTSTIEFMGRHLIKYRAHKEISQGMLPLVKVLCRNRKNAVLICNEDFLCSLAMVTMATNKFPAAVTILKLISRNPDAVREMSTSDRTVHFVLNMALNHVEKSAHKKYLMTTLYRITRNYNGAQIITRLQMWLMLLDIFLKTERMDELKQRIAATKAYTILNRGVYNDVISITPVNLKIKMSPEIEEYIAEKSNHHSDDSDNEESEDEDEGKPKDVAATEDNDDSDESEVESEDEAVDEVEEKVSPKIISDSAGFMKLFFREFYPDAKGNHKLKIRGCMQRNRFINRQAFPDAVFAQSDKSDGFYITPTINYLATDDMARKVRVLKGLEETGFKRKVVFDLDKLLAEGREEDVDVPEPEICRRVIMENEYGVHKNPRLCKQNSTRSMKFKRSSHSLQFESRFECGNLRKAEQIGDFEYNLFLSPDVNMINGLQWFYYQVSNMVAGECYTFNIVNFQKVNSQFNYGLQPVMFSVTDYLTRSTGWKKVGERLVYFGNEFVNKDSEKQFRTLSFTVAFPHGADYCYLAYHYPYTYTRLMTMVLPFLNQTERIYTRVDKLTTTVNGFNDVPLLTVTAPLNTDTSLNVPLKDRPLVFLTARVHPGESNSSWIMDGILQFLLDEQDEAAVRARERYVFKIIPMLNPEGVLYGNSRCGLTGNDLNRCWKKPHPVLHPEIYYAKKLVQFAKEQLGQPIFTFMDIHGHSRKKYFFLYGCNPKQSWNENDKLANDANENTYNLLPKALSATNENLKLSFCRYTIERKREATCRVVMWREFGIKYSYTLECSFCSGENKKKVTTKMLRDIGISIITALASIADTA